MLFEYILKGPNFYQWDVHLKKMELTSNMLVPLSFLLKRVEEKYAACIVQPNSSAKITTTNTTIFWDINHSYTWKGNKCSRRPNRQSNLKEASAEP